MDKNIIEYFRYPAASPRDRLWGLFVTGAGRQPLPPGSESPPPRPHPESHPYAWQQGRILDEYAIVYITDGRGEFDSVPTMLQSVAAGDAFLLFPGVWHRYRPIKEIGWETYWVHFQGEYADRMLKRGLISPEKAIFRVGPNEEIIRAFARMFDRLSAEPPGFQQMIAADTLEIMALVLGAARSIHGKEDDQAVVNRAKMMLEQAADGLPRVESLPDELGLSRARFFRLFKKQTGLTPYQYHLQLKLRRAGRMLSNTRTSVKEIAAALNFQSPDHFSRLFKRKMGLSPRAYRNRPWKSEPLDETDER